MKKILLGVVAVAFLLTSVPAFAEKGASAKAYEHASDEAVFHRAGDWFATIGKSDQEKQQILAERVEKGKIELEKNGITIPFPQRDVHLFQESKK